MGDTDTIDGIIRNPIDDDGACDRWPAGDRDPNGAPRYTRRLSDKILIAFHLACDQRDFEVAGHLLNVLELTSRAPTLPTGRDRRSKESLVAAHERLWTLRHPTLFER
jgi:hypothetical protein